MLVLPLIVTSLVCALAGIDAKTSGRIGRRAVIYYLRTTVVAVVIGTLVVTVIRPGSQAQPEVGERNCTVSTVGCILRPSKVSNIGINIKERKTRGTVSVNSKLLD